MIYRQQSRVHVLCCIMYIKLPIFISPCHAPNQCFAEWPYRTEEFTLPATNWGPDYLLLYKSSVVVLPTLALLLQHANNAENNGLIDTRKLKPTLNKRVGEWYFLIEEIEGDIKWPSCTRQMNLLEWNYSISIEIPPTLALMDHFMTSRHCFRQ